MNGFPKTVGLWCVQVITKPLIMNAAAAASSGTSGEIRHVAEPVAQDEVVEDNPKGRDAAECVDHLEAFFSGSLGFVSHR